MALRVEIWGLQLIQPFARMWQRQQQRQRERSQSLASRAAESTTANSTSEDLGVWVGAIRLRDLPAQRVDTNASRTNPRARRDNVRYLQPRSRRTWDEVAQAQKVRRIFEQNRIVSQPTDRDRSALDERAAPSVRARA
ncbi:MAG: hypothetical protein AAFY15_08550 [Cyanobacteria bacterium J06648_11]